MEYTSLYTPTGGLSRLYMHFMLFCIENEERIVMAHLEISK